MGTFHFEVEEEVGQDIVLCIVCASQLRSAFRHPQFKIVKTKK